MDRFDQLKVNVKGKKKLSIKSSREKIDRKMKAVDATQKDQPTDLNDQQYKLPWSKSNQLTVEGKGSVSAISFNKKDVRSIKQLQQWRTIKECKPKETKKQREKTDTSKTKSRE